MSGANIPYTTTPHYRKLASYNIALRGIMKSKIDRMTTPDQKAKEIVQKFVPYAYCDTMFTDGSQQAEEAWENAKACAHIYVDEILQLLKMKPDEGLMLCTSEKDYEYWQQVKQALQNG